MWMFLMYDLPTKSKSQRQVASQFRKSLQNRGFQMYQYSVYIREYSSKEQSDALIRQLQLLVPRGGRTYVLSISNRQFKNIIAFHKANHPADLFEHEQLCLF